MTENGINLWQEIIGARNSGSPDIHPLAQHNHDLG